MITSDRTQPYVQALLAATMTLLLVFDMKTAALVAAAAMMIASVAGLVGDEVGRARRLGRRRRVLARRRQALLEGLGPATASDA